MLCLPNLERRYTVALVRSLHRWYVQSPLRALAHVTCDAVHRRVCRYRERSAQISIAPFNIHFTSQANQLLLSLFQLLPRSLTFTLSSSLSTRFKDKATLRRISVTMKVLVSPSGFKESLDPLAAAECIERGILRACPLATVRKLPLVDGGEGFVEALVAVTNGQLVQLEVTGPISLPVQSHFGFLGDRPNTAVIEMAAAAGLRLVPRSHRDPTKTTTYGVGQTIKAALDAGAEYILLGCGDSGTCDAGVGMLQALGVKFFDAAGRLLPPAAGIEGLQELSEIDLSGMDSRLEHVKIDVACNWHNLLCGPKGVARIFGPQKGASQTQVGQMSLAMDRCADVFGRYLGRDIKMAPASGASGGLGAGLMVAGATLHPRYDIIMSFFDVDRMMEDCELVFTAEGGIDYQTPRGKIPAEVAKRAKRKGLPVIALAGTIGEGAQVNYQVGIDAYASIMQRPTTLENAIEEAEKLLTESAESAMRMVMIGRRSVTPEPKPEPSTTLHFGRRSPASTLRRRAKAFVEVRI
jgi:glycerate 2-kinase